MAQAKLSVRCVARCAASLALGAPFFWLAPFFERAFLRRDRRTLFRGVHGFDGGGFCVRHCLNPLCGNICAYIGAVTFITPVRGKQQANSAPGCGGIASHKRRSANWRKRKPFCGATKQASRPSRPDLQTQIVL